MNWNPQRYNFKDWYNDSDACEQEADDGTWVEYQEAVKEMKRLEKNIIHFISNMDHSVNKKQFHRYVENAISIPGKTWSSDTSDEFKKGWNMCAQQIRLALNNGDHLNTKDDK